MAKTLLQNSSASWFPEQNLIKQAHLQNITPIHQKESAQGNCIYQTNKKHEKLHATRKPSVLETCPLCDIPGFFSHLTLSLRYTKICWWISISGFENCSQKRRSGKPKALNLSSFALEFDTLLIQKHSGRQHRAIPACGLVAPVKVLQEVVKGSKVLLLTARSHMKGP